MLFLIDINQVMLISDADADFDWSLDALRLVQNQLILIDHGTDAAPQGSQILPTKYWLRRFWKGLKKVLIKYEKHPPTHIHAKNVWCCGEGYFGQNKIAEKERKSRQNVNRDKSA